MTARPSALPAGTGSTSVSPDGAHARSRSSPVSSRTTTIASAPVPVQPAARSALPAVVPAGTTTREVDAATADDGSDTTYSLDDLRMTADPDTSCRHSAGLPPLSPRSRRSNDDPHPPDR